MQQKGRTNYRSKIHFQVKEMAPAHFYENLDNQTCTKLGREDSQMEIAFIQKMRNI